MPQMTPGELKVMRLLWEHGEMKPADLQGRFPEPIKNPALRFYLTTLVERRSSSLSFSDLMMFRTRVWIEPPQ
jgi:hypothetical protein